MKTLKVGDVLVTNVGDDDEIGRCDTVIGMDETRYQLKNEVCEYWQDKDVIHDFLEDGFLVMEADFERGACSCGCGDEDGGEG